MAIYKNITSATTTTLITKGRSNSGGIHKILIANNHATNTTRVRLYIDDGSTEFNIVKTNIQPMVSLVLEDNLVFDSSIYDLKLETSEAGYDITVIIK